MSRLPLGEIRAGSPYEGFAHFSDVRAMAPFKLFAVLVAALLWAVWGAVRLVEIDFRPIRDYLERFRWLRLPNRMAVLLVVGNLVFFAGGKHSGTDGTDQTGGLMMMPPVSMAVQRPSPGFSLARIGTDETFDFSAPVCATVATNWLVRGAATDYLRLDLGDWVFPFGSFASSNLIAFADGRVMFPTNAVMMPFAASLGVVPTANWRLLSESNRPSLFWHEMQDDNTLETQTTAGGLLSCATMGRVLA